MLKVSAVNDYIHESFWFVFYYYLFYFIVRIIQEVLLDHGLLGQIVYLER